MNKIDERIKENVKGIARTTDYKIQRINDHNRSIEQLDDMIKNYESNLIDYKRMMKELKEIIDVNKTELRRRFES